ncbi:MAG TPA: TRL-like family protein [Candidatus Kapabacteria bacterium]|nr:TRL-like family protein [Candidatus Kapabacteria bacterium]
MKLFQAATLALAAATLGGCAVVATPSHGLLYTKVQGPIVVGNGVNTSKTGQACVTNILGLISTGDASIDAAKKAGGIKDVSSVDHDSTIMLGVYGQFCTVVKGN